LTSSNPSLTPQSNEAVHPLFHRASLYRLAVSESTFAEDNGEQSVRDFFQARRRSRLYAEWGPWELRRPQKVQKWGLGGPVDERIHQFLESQFAPTEEAVRGSRIPTHAAGEDEPSPALLIYRFDLHSDAVAPQLIRPAPRAQPPFPGCGQAAASTPLPNFWLRVKDLPDGHVCLALILNRGAVRLLKTLVETPEADLPQRIVPAELADEADAIAVITAALRSENLTGGSPNGRALRISTQLAVTPALQGMTSQAPFLFEVDLEEECPPLGDWTWVVLCVGPKPRYRSAGATQ
jgi:hypothetical protein